jgi:hypothetical protein
MQAIRWAIDWERAPSARGWKKKYVTENFQALPENVVLFEGKSEQERNTQMNQLGNAFQVYQRIMKGKNAAWMSLLEMYRSVGILHFYTPLLPLTIAVWTWSSP